MNKQWFAGICLRLSGQANAAWGELTNDPHRVARGRRDQMVGRAQQASAIERQESDRQLQDFQHRNRNWKT